LRRLDAALRGARGNAIDLTGEDGERIGYALVTYRTPTGRAIIGAVRWDTRKATEERAMAALNRVLRADA
jgi:hypothetical protein